MKVLVAICLILCVNCYGQECKCPAVASMVVENGKVKVFKFKNGKKIGVSGYVDRENKMLTYTEFSLFECGKDSVLYEWDATVSCYIKFSKDVLTIEELYGIANGKNMQIRWQPFLVSKYYYVNNNLVLKSYFKSNLSKYSGKQIKVVLDKYNNIQPGRRDNYDTLLVIAHQLFWAYVSGNNQAEQYLVNFDKKYGPFDGAIAEEWDDIKATYELYKDKKQDNQ